MEVTIDCRAIRTNEEFHQTFAAKLRLPNFYGGNLDALYDCLTSVGQKTTLNLIGVQSLIDNLGGYGRAAIGMMEQAERENTDRLRINMM